LLRERDLPDQPAVNLAASSMSAATSTGFASCLLDGRGIARLDVTQ
jgi:hypothetical protein